MTDLSVLITARNEEFLSRTVEDVLNKRRGDTEVIVILDGGWAQPPIKDHKDVTIVYHKESVGQRAAINEAARLARGKYIMKLDAHCIMDEGFDVKLIKDYQPQQIVIPAQYNLHAFNWRCKKCGNEWYQGPTPTQCMLPGEKRQPNTTCNGKDFEKKIIWEKRDSRRSEFYRFDNTLHFQYWGERKNHPESQQPIAPTMSCIGACWFLSLDYFWELEGMDEEHGSWGQMGTELACKTWLYGGSMVTNKNTWYAHLFRTQGGDFSFPYKQDQNQIDHAREHSRNMWTKGTWKKAKYPLHYLVERFWPVPGWTESDLKQIGGTVPSSNSQKQEKGIIYYTDNQLKLSIAHAAQSAIKKTGLPIVSSSLKPMSLGKNVVTNAQRGYVTMFKQILAALEALDTKYVFFCEHDVIYHQSHFDFTPPRDDTWYYNVNLVKVNAETGQTVRVDECKQVSGICVNRELAVKHYYKRMELVNARLFNYGEVDFNSWVRKMGFEPGTHRRPERVDDSPSDIWRSEFPNLDIRHGGNLTATRWSPEQFVNKKFTEGWTEGTILDTPGWTPKDFGFLKLG